MSIQNIPIGIIGTGGIAQVHLTAYKSRGFNVVAVCDIDENKVKTTAEKFGIKKYFTDFNKLLQIPEIQVVDIALQPWQRLPVIEASAKAGKHILCQKPFAMSMKHAVAFVDICESYGVKLMVNQNSCFVPGFLAIEPYMKPEFMGDIYYSSIEATGFYPNFPERHLISAMIVHHIALVHKWFGNISSVFAMATREGGKIEDGENLGVLMLEFESGVKCLLVTNWVWRGDAGGRNHPIEEIRIQGTKGNIFGHSEDMNVHLTEPEIKDIRPEIKGIWFPDAFGNSMAHFLECVAKDLVPITNGRDNLDQVMRTVFAAYRSIEEKRAISPQEIPYDSDINLNRKA
jgi:predicted dehydrogenase